MGSLLFTLEAIVLGATSKCLRQRQLNNHIFQGIILEGKCSGTLSNVSLHKHQVKIYFKSTFKNFFLSHQASFVTYMLIPISSLIMVTGLWLALDASHSQQYVPMNESQWIRFRPYQTRTALTFLCKSPCSMAQFWAYFSCYYLLSSLSVFHPLPHPHT